MEDPDNLVNSLTIETSTLGEGNLSGLSTTDYQTLNALSHELTLGSVEAEGNSNKIYI